MYSIYFNFKRFGYYETIQRCLILENISKKNALTVSTGQVKILESKIFQTWKEKIVRISAQKSKKWSNQRR
jgi:hypothetical protein